jgi:hypothetical protein
MLRGHERKGDANPARLPVIKTFVPHGSGRQAFGISSAISICFGLDPATAAARLGLISKRCVTREPTGARENGWRRHGLAPTHFPHAAGLTSKRNWLPIGRSFNMNNTNKS